MPELGTKHECFSCHAKFYDLGRSEAICPRCGANQKDAKNLDHANEATPSKRRRKEEVVRVAEVEEEEDLVPAPQFGDEELVAPEGGDETEGEIDDDDEDEV